MADRLFLIFILLSVVAIYGLTKGMYLAVALPWILVIYVIYSYFKRRYDDRD
jgi:hypothetical protein